MSRRPMTRSDGEAIPESDRFKGAPHPRDMFDFFGHEAAEQELLEAYRSGKLPQAWIIGGKEGIGKATLAWRFARFVLAHGDPQSPPVANAQDLSVDPEHPVARRMLAMSHNDVVALRRSWDPKGKKHFTDIRVDDARRAIDMFHHASGEGGWRVAIVDSAEDLNGSSANALLKLIEEPPPRSLFLIVAHRPSQVLPTIRSRARKLILGELAPATIVETIRALGEPWDGFEPRLLEDAARRAGGSVRDALRLLGGDSLQLIQAVDGLLAQLPSVDWRRVHQFADRLTGREATEEFEAMISAIFDWIDAGIRAQAGHPGTVRRLAPLAEVWDKIALSARETLALNLDRRAFILNVFSDLSAAVATAQR
ncbi:DNA polymerase III subunit delta' [Roseiarcaceae bacterium H3SJ34-1]|uniref:DNA polymerase III subunit delta' n=1 Tax=Terripilifer ovatus TaxID=3032367 RepID=UPI003AB97F21|nr:DNA polymerase III subunit delta' [Roseiarcaceae bacterium H3SJ34-1]